MSADVWACYRHQYDVDDPDLSPRPSTSQLLRSSPVLSSPGESISKANHRKASRSPEIVRGLPARGPGPTRQSQRDFAGDEPFQPRTLPTYTAGLPQHRGSPGEYTGYDVSLPRGGLSQHVRRLRQRRGAPTDFNGENVVPFQARDIQQYASRSPPLRGSPPRAAYNESLRPAMDSYAHAPPPNRDWRRPAGTPAPMSMRKRHRDESGWRSNSYAERAFKRPRGYERQTYLGRGMERTSAAQPASEEEKRYFYKMAEEARSFQREEAEAELERRVAEAGLRIQKYIDLERARLEGLQAGMEALKLEAEEAREKGRESEAHEEVETAPKPKPRPKPKPKAKKEESVPVTPGKKTARARKSTGGVKKGSASIKAEEKQENKPARRSRRSSVKPEKKLSTAPTPANKQKTAKDEAVLPSGK